jgi:hypothetical protein
MHFLRSTEMELPLRTVFWLEMASGALLEYLIELTSQILFPCILWGPALDLIDNDMRWNDGSESTCVPLVASRNRATVDREPPDR